MLYFYCARKRELPKIARRGIRADKTPVRLWHSLEDVRSDCPSKKILVIDGFSLHAHAALKHQTNGNRTVSVSSVPTESIQNIDPYLRPRRITAAGGYVLRGGTDEPEVLTIFRRGVWDLPKGKVEKRESPEDGALREVREEVGIEKLELIGQVGTTMHGYARNNRYHVKTTYWYAMKTPQTSFTPERKEQIERVEYMKWSDARINMGYETLRRHMDEIEDRVRQLVDDPM